MEVEIKVMWPKANKCQQLQELEGTRNGFCSRASERSTDLMTPRF